MASKLKLLITVPHACQIQRDVINSDDIGCDLQSRTYAKHVHKNTKDSYLILSKTRRAICDNNRVQCRNTSMRRRLRKYMTTFRGQFALLDIHTFQSGLDFDLPKDEEDVEVILLDTHITHYNVRLLRCLQHVNIHAHILPGSHENDIQYESRQFGSKASIIIEIRQQLDAKRMKRIVQCIRQWWLKVSKVKSNVIVSPTYGTVDRVVHHGDRSVIVSIHIVDNHDVFAPVHGKITSIKYYNGYWKRKMFIVPDENKTGRVIIDIEMDQSKETVSFWLEVGHAFYVTNRIRLDVKIGDQVQKGERIGEIMLGSLAKTLLPPGYKVIVKPYQRLRGGVTPIAVNAKV